MSEGTRCYRRLGGCEIRKSCKFSGIDQTFLERANHALRVGASFRVAVTHKNLTNSERFTTDFAGAKAKNRQGKAETGGSEKSGRLSGRVGKTLSLQCSGGLLRLEKNGNHAKKTFTHAEKSEENRVCVDESGMNPYLVIKMYRYSRLQNVNR